MLRLVGAVMIILAGSALGFLKADRMKKRTETIGGIITGLGLLETDIAYGKKALSESLLEIGEVCGIKLFLDTAEKMGEVGVKAAFLEAAEGEEYLNLADKDALLELSGILGMTDTASQKKAIKRAVSVLSARENEAREEYKRLGKLYRECGVLGGILGAVILI